MANDVREYWVVFHFQGTRLKTFMGPRWFEARARVVGHFRQQTQLKRRARRVLLHQLQYYKDTSFVMRQIHKAKITIVEVGLPKEQFAE